MLPPGSGTGQFSQLSTKVIRFVRKGCTNRPFFHIVVAEQDKEQFLPVIEQVGSYDPMPNEFNEKLISLNFERIRHWVGNGALFSPPVQELLGLAGFLPIHPRSYMTAWRNRRTEKLKESSEIKEEKTENADSQNSK